MELYNDKITELENAVKTHDEEITLDTIIEMRKRLDYFALRLNDIHNSKIPINKLPADILYNIFAIVVKSGSPGTNAIRISSVCRHWRNYTLRWPTLWTYISLPSDCSFLEFLVGRSGDAPLELIWEELYEDEDYRCNYFFAPMVPCLFSRMHSLSLSINTKDFNEFQDICQSSELTPSVTQQLRHLAVDIFDNCLTFNSSKDLSMDFLPMDICRLETLKLNGVHLSSLVLSRNIDIRNNLTNLGLTYRSETPPDLSHFLLFLSNCPLLTSFSLDIRGDATSPLSPTTYDGGTIINSPLDFLQLKDLTLKSSSIHGYNYIRDLATHIRAPILSHFQTRYIDPALIQKRNSRHGRSEDTLPPRRPNTFDIFKTIPSGTLRRFTDLSYLHIDINSQSFRIAGSTQNLKPNGPRRYEISGPAWTGLFDVYGELEVIHAAVDYSPILELIRTMPKMTHLRLDSSAWLLFDLFSDTDIDTILPCLHTLELAFDEVPKALNTLLAFLRPKTLISATLLSMMRSDDDGSFLDAVLEMGVEVVILDPVIGHGLGHAVYAMESKLADALVSKGISVTQME